MRPTLALLLFAATAVAQQPGKNAYQAFQSWRTTAGATKWADLLDRYRHKLEKDGRAATDITRALEAIEAYDEGSFYDEIYAKTPKFNTRPNRLLAEAVKGRRPGTALDIAMGQGRNAVYLAGRG